MTELPDLSHLPAKLQELKDYWEEHTFKTNGVFVTTRGITPDPRKAAEMLMND